MSLFQTDGSEDRVEELRKHLNALDNAVQSHEKEIDQVVEVLTAIEDVESFVEENTKDIKTLKRIFRQFNEVQSDYMRRVDSMNSELESVSEELSRLSSKVQRLKQSQDALFEEIENLNERIDGVENQFIVEANRQEMDLDSKLDAEEFEDHRSSVKQELSKLRTSINSISDKLEKEKIEVDQS